MIMMTGPAELAGSAKSARGTPRNVASGPYMLPSRAMGPPGDRSDHNAGTVDQSALAQDGSAGEGDGRPTPAGEATAWAGGGATLPGRRRRGPGRPPARGGGPTRGGDVVR